MEWTPVNPDRIPDSEVLAANFKKGTYGHKCKILGLLRTNDDSVTGVSADSEYDTLDNVTHYVELKKHDIY